MGVLNGVVLGAPALPAGGGKISLSASSASGQDENVPDYR